MIAHRGRLEAPPHAGCQAGVLLQPDDPLPTDTELLLEQILMDPALDVEVSAAQLPPDLSVSS